MSPEEVLAILSRKMQEGIATVGSQAAQVAQHAAQVAEDKVTVEKYMQTAGESKKQALEAAERLKDSVKLVQKNTVDLQGKAPVIIESATSHDGTPVEVNDSAEMQLQGLRLYGKSKQVTTTGANLFDANDVSEGVVDDRDGSIIINTNSHYSNFIAVNPKTKYYLYSNQNIGKWGGFYDLTKTFILGLTQYNTVFETPENAAYVRFTVNYNNNNPDFARNVIFAKSTIAVPFEPYHKSTTTIPLSNDLPGISVTAGGNYTDENGQQYICNEIDFAAGKYVQRVKEIVLDGSYDEVWTYNIGAHRANIILNNGNLGTYDQRGIASMCSNLLWNRNVYSDSNRENGYLINNNTFFVRVAESLALNTEPDFRTWLASNPITLQYVLATPIETDLSEAQIQAYKSLTTFKPTSIISNDANAQMNVEYVCDTKTYIDNKLQEIAQALVASASEAE